MNGNLIQDNQNRQFTYNGDNKQTLVKDANNQVVGQYDYNGDGLRVKKVSDIETTIFVYDASNRLVAEYSTQIEQNPQTSYLTTDNLGSVRIITNQIGQVIKKMDFRPFGEELARANSGQSNVKDKFATYKRDDETGLDFAQARMFGSNYGRFTAIDPTLRSMNGNNPQSFNRYVYVMNNPLAFVDPLGLWGIRFDAVYKKKDGKETTEIDHYNAVAVQTKGDKDTPAELARQLGLKGKEADNFVKDFGKKLDGGKITGDNVQLSKLGGDVGRVFGVVQDLYSDQRKEDAKGKGKNPGNGTYADCSSTCANLNSPLTGANGQNWSVFVMDEFIKDNLTSKSESDLRIGDAVRYADEKNVPKHFTTFIFRNDDGVPQVFSRSGEGGRFETGSASNFTSANPRFSGYGTIRGIGKDSSGYYGRR